MRKFILLATLSTVIATTFYPVPVMASQNIGAGPQSAYHVNAFPKANSCHYFYAKNKEVLPDPKCTPGAINPLVTQTTISSTICSYGYTKSIRPPESVTYKEKVLSAKSYNYYGLFKDSEFDHLIPLELGGDPNDSRNLWIQPPSKDHKTGTGTFNKKDLVENALKKAVCAKKLALATAQRLISADWTTALLLAKIKS